MNDYLLLWLNGFCKGGNFDEEISNFVYSVPATEAKQVRTITVCAMFGAIAVILGYYSIEIGPYIRIGFADIPNRLVDYLFGPVVGGCFGGILDLLKFMMKPSGQFFPGFTLTA